MLVLIGIVSTEDLASRFVGEPVETFSGSLLRIVLLGVPRVVLPEYLAGVTSFVGEGFGPRRVTREGFFVKVVLRAIRGCRFSEARGMIE
jgi:hypothetical protein